jgi:protein NRD1
LHRKCSGKQDRLDRAVDVYEVEADATLPQSESVLIQKLYTHFKKAPGTHKLGVLYVVDSVTRKWTEQAKSAGQPINSAAQDGTFAAGVHRVKELLPVLMNDIILSSPDDQKVRPNA